ncbi:SGNH/GDSL hydrolase family protein [Actinokineospora soli]|uniref:SGNH/GDSL hydrolase family protein n=1 Tax=Actinokineospora soli TaxID=1048753 RepID=A0ABW2TN26_9PSEU
MRRTAAALSAIALCATVTTATAQAATIDYVALGDSAAAGPLIPDQVFGTPCARSTNNYPAVVAKALGAQLTDVSCSGATVEHLAGKQFGYVAPQYDALNAGTDLVTITIGGNDIGLVQAALSCVNALPKPIGISCADRFASGGTDQLAKAITEWAPVFGGALDRIRARAPQAKVVVAGYGTYIRQNGCWPLQPIWDVDANYMQSTVNKLNTVLRQQTVARGGTYVDIAAVSVGHDTCAAPADRHLEGLVPTSPAAPLHPNARGMAAFGAAVAAAARP